MSCYTRTGHSLREGARGSRGRRRGSLRGKRSGGKSQEGMGRAGGCVGAAGNQREDPALWGSCEEENHQNLEET